MYVCMYIMRMLIYSKHNYILIYLIKNNNYKLYKRDQNK